MSKVVDICIKIPKNVYNDLEKRSRVMGTNVQTYIRSLLERHVSRARGEVHGLETKEVDIVNKLRHIVLRLRDSARNGFRDVALSKTCSEDLDKIIDDIVDKIRQRIADDCGDQELRNCKEYVEFDRIRARLGEVQEASEKVKLLVSKYSSEVLQSLKQLFYMERCSLAELAKILYNASEDYLQKILLTLVELD